MNELTLDGKDYVSSKRAAEITGYAKDYVGQLCREGRVEARLVGRNWYILKSAIQGHRFVSAGEDSGNINEEISSKTAGDEWEAPRYEVEVVEPLPLSVSSLNKLDQDAEMVVEEIQEPHSALESMQDAWKGWFNRDEIAAETPEESETDEVSVAIHSISQDSIKRQTLNLRHIREYDVDEEMNIDEDVKINEWAVRPATRGGYRVLKIMFIGVALCAVVVALVGSGLTGNIFSSSRQVSELSGVYFYNK